MNKKTYIKPAIGMYSVKIENLLNGGSVTGENIRGNASSGWSGFSREGNGSWDDED